MSTLTKDFFISFNHLDSGWAEWIGWQLESAGYTTIIQMWDFAAGSNFIAGMDIGLANSKRVIAVLSPNYLQSQFVMSEWAAVLAEDPTGRESRLVPVRVKEVELHGLLKAIVWIDLVGKDEETARGELLARISPGRKKPVSTPRFPRNRDEIELPQESAGGQLNTTRYMIVLTGSIGGADRSLVEAIMTHLRTVSEDATLTLHAIGPGSLCLLLRGRRSGFERLQAQISNGGLTILGHAALSCLMVWGNSGTPIAGQKREALAESNFYSALYDIRSKEEAQEILDRGGVDDVLALLVIVGLVCVSGTPNFSATSFLERIHTGANNARAILADILADDSLPLARSAAYLLRVGFTDPQYLLEFVNRSIDSGWSEVDDAIVKLPVIYLAELIVSLVRQKGEISWQLSKLLETCEPTAVPSLVEALADESAAVRQAAAEALRTVGTVDANALPALAARLNDPVDSVRRAVVQTIGNISNSAASDCLIEALRDSAASVRLAAAGGLGEKQYSSPAVVTALEQLLADEDDHVHRVAALSLAAKGRLGVPPLLNQLRHTSQHSRLIALNAVSELDDSAAAVVDEVITLLGDSDAAVREYAAAALAKIAQHSSRSISSLTSALDDSSASVRAAAADALSSLGPVATDALPRICKALEDPEESVRAAATSAYPHIHQDGTSAVEVLLRMLRDGSQRVQRAAVIELGKFGDFEAAIAQLIRVSESDKDPELRETALFALISSGAGPAMLAPVLLSALDDEDELVRETAADGLRRVAPEAITPLLVALEKANDDIRAAAVAALNSARHDTNDVFHVKHLVTILFSPDPASQIQAEREIASVRPIAPVVVEHLLRGLSNSNPPTRRAAAHAIGRALSDHRAALTALIAALDDQNAEVRNEVVDAIIAFGPESLSDLSNVVSCGSTEMRGAAADAIRGLFESIRNLCDSSDSRFAAIRANAVSALAAALQQESPETKRAVARALGEIGPAAASALPALLSELHSAPSLVLQDAIVGAMYNIVTDINGGTLPDAPIFEATFRDCLLSGSAEVRHYSAAILAKLGLRAVPVIANVVPMLRHRSMMTRQFAADALAQIGAVALPQLLDAWRDEEPEVRVAVLDILERMGSNARDAVPLLMRELASSEEEPVVIYRIIRNGIMRGPGPIEDTLAALLSNQDQQVRSRILGRIARLGDSLLPILNSLRGHGSPAVRELASEAIEIIVQDQKNTLAQNIEDENRRESIEKFRRYDR